MKLLSILFIFILISCGHKSEYNDETITYIEAFDSVYNPCQIPGNCTNVKELTYEQAIAEMSQEKNLVDPVIGSTRKTWEEKAELTQAFDDTAQTQAKVKCGIAYNQERTVLSFDDDYVYFLEKKYNFKLQPNLEVCQSLLYYSGDYKPKVITKENRTQFNSQSFIATLLPSYKYTKALFLHKEIIQITGVDDTKAELKIFTFQMYELGKTFLSSGLINHAIINSSNGTWEDVSNFNDEFISKSSHKINVKTLSEYDIEDRTNK